MKREHEEMMERYLAMDERLRKVEQDALQAWSASPDETLVAMDKEEVEGIQEVEAAKQQENEEIKAESESASIQR